MTSFEPRIALRRLIVVSAGEPAYDEKYHLGVNIICGEKNSVGKSTIAHFIFYALGGEGVVWTEAARACSTVMAEVALNGIPITLRRAISDDRENPVELLWGDYEQASQSPPTAWQRYPFAQRGAAQSFSQVLFRGLRIPQVRGHLASRITLHQCLRLMFADQKSPAEEMFRQERFSSNDMLEAVGSLLCGVYDDRLYEVGFILRDKVAQRDEITGRLKTIWAVLRDTEQTAGVDLLRVRLGNTERELEEAYAELKRVRTGETLPAAGQRDVEVGAAAADLEAKNQAVEETKKKITSLAFEVDDSAHFLQVLRKNLTALEDATAVAKTLGQVAFRVCPQCFTPIVSDRIEGQCPLCGQREQPQQQDAYLLRLRQEIVTQITESEGLQRARTDELEGLQVQLPALETSQKMARQRYEEVSTVASTAREGALAACHEKIGFLRQKAENLQEQIKLAESIDKSVAEKATLDSEISRLLEEQARLIAARKTKEAKAHDAIRKRLREILTRDLPVQEEFVTPVKVDFSFRENKVTVEDRANFSESSMVYLRNAFHLALLLASTDDPQFLYPRFALFDGLEEGGTQPERSQNLQRLIVELSANAPTEHQIIFTTSMVDPGLRATDMVVGKYYTTAERALRLRRQIPDAATALAPDAPI